MEPTTTAEPTVIYDSATDAPTDHPIHIAMTLLSGVDFAALILDARNRLVFANRIAFDLLARRFTLSPGKSVTPLHGSQNRRWSSALETCRQNHQAQITIESAAGSVNIGLLSIASIGERELSPYVMASGPRKSCCSEVMLNAFCDAISLTPSETAVVSCLAKGLYPSEIAFNRNVAESTVRSQVKSILAKAEVHSIRSLVFKLSSLPPIMTVDRKVESISD